MFTCKIFINLNIYSFTKFALYLYHYLIKFMKLKKNSTIKLNYRILNHNSGKEMSIINRFHNINFKLILPRLSPL